LNSFITSLYILYAVMKLILCGSDAIKKVEKTGKR
jgi:hypothetical protein